jgi:capsid protein
MAYYAYERKFAELKIQVVRFRVENTQLKLVATEWQKKATEWSRENAQLKQLLADFVKDSNKQSREIVRLRGIIEQAKDYCKRMIEWANYKTVIEILNGVDKGEGRL